LPYRPARLHVGEPGPSYVLRALGRNDELAHSSIRFTLGRFTTEEDVDYTIKLVKEKVGKLRELSPLWDMYKEGIRSQYSTVGGALNRASLSAHTIDTN